MKRPQLVLHFGTHKTGTTAIQDYCSRNVDVLFEKGIFYPDYYPFSSKFKDGHHSLAHSFVQKDNGVLDGKVSKLIDLWRFISESSGAKLFLSSESMYRHLAQGDDWYSKRRSYLSLIRDAFSGFDITPVVVYRRPDAFIKSLFQEEVKSTVNVDYSFESYADKKKFWLDYDRNTKLLEEVFGNVICLNYEKISRGSSLIENMLSEIFGVDSDSPIEDQVIRKSWSPVQTHIKNYANSIIDKNSVGRKFSRWVESKDCEKLIVEEFGSEEFDIWPSKEQRVKFCEKHLENLGDFCGLRFGGCENWTLDTSTFSDLKPPVLTRSFKSKIEYVVKQI